MQRTLREASTKADYSVGNAVWFCRAANLGGAAGVASFQPQWREGEVVGHSLAEGGFFMYEIQGDDGSHGHYAAAHVKHREVYNQFLEPVPSDWMNAPEPLHPRRKRIHR